MKKNICYLGIVLFVLPFAGSSQTLIDAYRLSSQKINGTARSAAMGNAFGALGGDFTSLSINPAGIAIYRSNEFVITPTARFNNSEMNVSGGSFSDDKYAHSINNVGYIGTIKGSESSELGIVSINFGMGMNTVLDLNQNSFGQVNASNRSFLDGIVSWANSESLSNNYLNKPIGDIEYRDWPTKLAKETFLMYPVKDNNGNTVDGQYSNILYPNEKVNQQINYSYKGGIKEYVLAGGINFAHKFYAGATIGIQDVNITKNSQYAEWLEGDNSFTFYEDNFIKGSGYNLKLGAIYKPVNFLRLGLAFHTPTFYKVNDDMRLTMESRLQNTHKMDGLSLFDYQLYSPYKFILSGAVVINKYALISIDGEFVDYSNIKYDSEGTSNSMSDLNSDVKNAFTNVFNLRVGGELKLNQYFSARGGFEFYPMPYRSNYTSSDTWMNGDNSICSVGFGYMANGFFADFAFRHSTDKYNFYNPQPNFENVIVKNNNDQLLVTIGFKF